MLSPRLPARSIAFLIALLFVAIAVPGSAQRSSKTQKRSANPSLLIILEGLRPDQITPKLTPNLHEIASEGVRFSSHRAVFPPVAGVNAASITTGSYPSTHGILGNHIRLDASREAAIVDVRNLDDLRRLRDQTAGSPLTVPALGEVLSKVDRELLIVGTGPPGSTFLLDPGAEMGVILHPEFTVPANFNADLRNAEPQSQSSAWVVDTYLEVGLNQLEPDLTILWIDQPAHAQGEFGIGSTSSDASLRDIDTQIGRILQRHDDLRLKVNVLVTSAFGFSTRSAETDLREFLVDEGLKANRHSGDVAVVDNSAIYVEGHDRSKIQEIVQRLEKEDWVGALYTQQIRLTHPESFVPGALSFQAVFMDHSRAPDILVEPTWSDEQNSNGYAGTNRGSGNAQTGSSSPYDLKVAFIAAGPDIKSGLETAVPSAHIDLAPTLYHLLGVEPPDNLDGRVLHEALRGGPKPDSVHVLRRRHGSQAKWANGSYRLIMSEVSVDGIDYLEFTKVDREGSR